MLSFLENSQSNPYALGKSNDEFLNMDITFAGLYKKALTENQQQSLMTTINKTYKNVYYGTVKTFTIQVTQSSAVPVFIFNGDTSVENPMVPVGTVGLYIFDQSHPSNAGFPIAFRNIQSPFTPYTNVIVEGTPGTPNSYSLVSITDVSAPLLVEYYTTSTETNAESIFGELLNYLYQVKVETNIVGDPVFGIQSPGQSAYVLQPDLSFNEDVAYFYVGDDSMADISLVFGPTVDDTANVVGSPYYVKMGDIIRLDLTSGYTGDPLVYFEDSSNNMGYVSSSSNGTETNVVPTVLWYNFDTSTVTGNTITNVATGSSLGDAVMKRSSIVTDVTKTGSGSLLCVRDSGQMQYVTLPSLTLPNEFTICFWHKMTPDSDFARNIYLLYFLGVNITAQYSDKHTIEIEVTNGSFQMLLNDSQVDKRYDYGAYPNDNAWHHLMFTKSSTEFKVYIDNVVQTPDKTVNMATFSSSIYNSHYISGRYDLLTGTADLNMGGHTDDYRFYNKVLDSTERNTVYTYAPTQLESYTVDVSNDVFRLDSGDGNGFADKPPVDFANNSGTIYVFDQSHTSNANNTLVIGTAPDISSSIVSSGLTIMGTPGQPGAYTKYVSDGSTVYYFSYQNENMGEEPPMYTVKVVDHEITGEKVFSFKAPGGTFINQPDLSFGAGDRYQFDVRDSTMTDISLVFGPTVDDSTSINESVVTRINDLILLDISAGYTGDPLVYFEDSSAGMGYVPGSSITIDTSTDIDVTFNTANASASNYGSSFTPDLAFNSNYTQGDSWITYWSSPNRYDSGDNYPGTTNTIVDNVTISGEWLQMDFGSEKYIGKFTLSTFNDWDDVNTGFMTEFVIAGSNDGSNFTEIGTYNQSNILKSPTNYTSSEITSTNVIASRYIRLIGVKVRINMAIREWQMKEHHLSEGPIYTVEVSSDSFWIQRPEDSGLVEKPAITFNDNTTYIFDQSDSTNANNTLVIGTAFDDPTSIVSSGLTIMGTPGQPGAYTKYVSDGTRLYYFSYQNENMGYEKSPQ